MKKDAGDGVPPQRRSRVFGKTGRYCSGSTCQFFSTLRDISTDKPNIDIMDFDGLQCIFRMPLCFFVYHDFLMNRWSSSGANS